MKKALVLLGLLSVAALASCDKRENREPEQAPGKSFRGTIEEIIPDVSSKAYATHENSTYYLFWNRYDRVSIFYDRTYNREYEFQQRDGSTAGTFERVGEDPAHITEQDITTGFDYAIYPYDRDNACNTIGELTVVIPEKQEFYNDRRGIGVRPMMVAQSETGDFFFKHVGAYLCIRVRGEGFALKSISFQGNNSEIIAGYPTVSFKDGDPVLEFDPRDLDNSDTITMELDTPVELDPEEYSLFWLDLPSVTLDNGYTITLKDQNGRTFKKETDKPVTFNRRMFYRTSVDNVVIETTPVSSVSLDKEELALNVGEDETLVATVLPEEADDKAVTWSSSNSDVAEVDDNGKVTAKEAGIATITVTTNDGGKTASCAVTVSDVITYELAISPAEEEINALESLEYTVTLTTVKNGVSSDSQVAATLTSSNIDVATVSGLTATGVAKGTATITASYTPEGETEALTAEATLSVKDVITYSLAIDPEEAEVIIGTPQAYTLTLTTTTNGKDVTSDVTAASATTWSSSNTEIASVSGGTATGAKEGTVTITATYTPSDSDTLSVTAELTVNKKPNQAGDPTPIEDDDF